MQMCSSQMKMNFPLKSSVEKRRRFGGNPLWWIVGIFTLLFFVGYLFSSAFYGAVQTAVAPIFSGRLATLSGLGRVGEFFSTRHGLIGENELLKAQIMALELQVIDYEHIRSENDALQSVVGRGSATSTDRILARVVSKPPQAPYDVFIIDQGTADGVFTGSQVLLSDTILVGYVDEASAHSARVVLFSDDGEQTPAELSRTGASFELVGSGAGNMRLTVPLETDVQWGDALVHPQFSSAIIGNVYYIDTESQTSFKTAHIRVPFSVFSAKWVWVQRQE